MLTLTERGPYCEAGDFHIDPWQPVERAVITHAHGDHARRGSKRYLTTTAGAAILRRRLDGDAAIETLAYGQSIEIGDVRVSLHPACHIAGSAQVRVEHRGEVWVVSGDYKREPDATCMPFEPVPCHTFITEATFALPIYRWEPQQTVLDAISAWWRSNREQGRTTVLLVYALGKAQRLLAGLDASIGPIALHGAVDTMTQAYREAGVALPEAGYADDAMIRAVRGGGMVIAPPAVNGSSWIRRFKPFASAMVSGWMMVRGARRHRHVDRGFVLSDHADWPGLLQTIDETGAQRIGITHGHTAPLARYLREQGRETFEWSTRYEAEGDGEAMADNG